MCKGVQHPVRGLFLRAYLTQVTKPVLLLPPAASAATSHVPDAAEGPSGAPIHLDGGSVSTGGGGGGGGADVADAVDFVLANFTEMNRLWVRLGQHGPARDAKRREAERAQLRDLVGKNIMVLSGLEVRDATGWGEGRDGMWGEGWDQVPVGVLACLPPARKVPPPPPPFPPPSHLNPREGASRAPTPLLLLLTPPDPLSSLSLSLSLFLFARPL